MERSNTLIVFSIASILILGIIGLSQDVYAAPQPAKITICHIPPGDPNNPQTITVSEKSLKAHTDHGDHITGPEVCDGLDNDCNGVVDDGIATTPTSCGVGTCADTGVLACISGALQDSCQPGTPTFFIGTEEDGFIKLVGAQPFSAFQAAIDDQLG